MDKKCEGCGSIGICHDHGTVDYGVLTGLGIDAIGKYPVGNITQLTKEPGIFAGELLSKHVKNSLQFLKVREVTSPNRGTSQSAGIDFYVPSNFDGAKLTREAFPKNIEFTKDEIGVILSPGSRVLIPSGIKTIIPKGYALIMFNKSGVSSKLGLDVLACVIDEDYRGEIHINLVNTGTLDVAIRAGDKIVQGILLPVNYADCVEISEDVFNADQTVRGAGGFGSTGV